MNIESATISLILLASDSESESKSESDDYDNESLPSISWYAKICDCRKVRYRNLIIFVAFCFQSFLIFI